MNKIKRKIVVVVGPTGSGKTSLAVKLAKGFNGEIVSADSRQVFRGLDLGTGKDLDDLKDVKYHLIDIRDPGEEFTLFDWLKEARKIINAIFERDKTPIVVGGTGLYVQALIQGFVLRQTQKSKLKNQNDISNVKDLTREELNKKTLEELQNMVNDLGVDTTNIDLENSRRLIRVIEKHQNQEAPTKKKPDFDAILIAPEWSREELFHRIDKRLDQRFDQEMLEETKALINDGVDPEWLITLGLDYKVMTKYLLSKKIPRQARDDSAKKLKSYDLQAGIAFKAMKEDLKIKEHQYAKRQLTWWKRFDLNWVNDYEDAKRLVGEFLNK